MKLLKIEKGKSTFSIDGKSFKSIKDIEKDDIKEILNVIYNDEDGKVIFEEENDEDVKILNEAEKIIHNSILERLKVFTSGKEDLKAEINDEFSEVLKKY